MSSSSPEPRRVAPYGTWASPITSAFIVADFVGLGSVAVGRHGELYWREVRPTEGGRAVIVRREADGRCRDLTPEPFYVRTRVNEYGGGDFLVARETLFFSNFVDQRLYRQPADGSAPPVAMTPDSGATLRYADTALDPARDRLVAVRDDHRVDPHEPRTSLVAIALDAEGDDPGQVLVEGHDFYAAPTPSPDGQWLAYLAWNHPQMPWDGTELWLARIAPDGRLESPRRVAGGPEEAVQQPRWSPDGRLHFVSDRSGWWNLYRMATSPDAAPAEGDAPVEALWPLEAEFGKPPWILGLSTYAFVPGASGVELYCTYGDEHGARLGCVDTATLETRTLELCFAAIGSLRAAPGALVFRTSAVDAPDAFVRLDLVSGALETLRTAGTLELETDWISAPQSHTFANRHGEPTHALLYLPKNPRFEAPPGERPPMLVRSHGGPTASSGTALDLGVQYWTSRGWAVLDVDYGGSTGYGRAYRERLRGKWGEVDVEDCVAAARWLIEQGTVDAARVTIDGRSAGGLTTLLALLEPETPFAAGASHFGVSDLCRLAEDTHKFESRYLESLIGRWPEERALFEARSPISRADQFDRPTIFLQGDEDRVVPPDQSSRMAEALRRKGVPVAYLLFEGEQHGFRKAQHIRRALDAEFTFYARCFGFTPADGFEPIEIENLPPAADPQSHA